MEGRLYQCVVCGEKMDIDAHQECGSSTLTGERNPLHCGKDMIEVPE